MADHFGEGIFKFHSCCNKWDLSVSQKETIHPLGFPAPFAPITLASHWIVYLYVDKMLLVFLHCLLYDSVNKIILKLKLKCIYLNKNILYIDSN